MILTPTIGGMVQVLQIPFSLAPSEPHTWKYEQSGPALQAMALPKSDLYCNPKGEFAADAPSVLNALTLLGAPLPEDFQFSTRVKVEFNSAYDAGVLLIWEDERTWAKLCFEYSPDQEAMVVSVVTLGTSDDANSFTLSEYEVWLRISRMGQVYAFHASTDGQKWKLVRVFTLGQGFNNHLIGFEAQAPVGDGCSVTFDRIDFSYSTLLELRDGS